MKGNISNVTGAIDIVARNRYRESATACGVRRMKERDGMIRFVSILLLSFLMSFMGNSTALAKIFTIKKWDFAAYCKTVDNKTPFSKSGTQTKISGTACDNGINEANGLAFQGNWIYYTTGGLYSSNSGGRWVGVLNLKAGDKVTFNTDGGLPTTCYNGVYDSEHSTTNKGIYTVTADGNFGINMTRYFTIASITVERDVTTFELSYNKGDDALVLGTVPDGVEYDVTEASALPQYKLPANVSLYKSGFTLTGWNDGENTQEYGKTLTLFEDVTFTPVFTENKVARKDALAPVNAIFSTLTFTESGTEKYFVTQSSFNSELQDVYIKVDGKTLSFDAINGVKIRCRMVSMQVILQFHRVVSVMMARCLHIQVNQERLRLHIVVAQQILTVSN